MPSYLLITLCIFSLLSSNTFANAKKDLESAFASSLILTNGESISLGYGNFDPNILIDPHQNNLDVDEALALRHQLTLYSLPFDFNLNDPISGYKSTFRTKVNYLEQKHNVDIFDNEQSDLSAEKMLSVSLGASIEKPISSNWLYRTRINAHLMHYTNDYVYNSRQSKQQLKPITDGIYSNISSRALIINPSASFVYKLPRNWGHYEYKLKFEYYYGWALSQPQSLKSINPESWQINNAIKANFNMFSFFDLTQSFYVKAQRVDLGADAIAPLGTNHFYEFGFGFLWDVSNWTDWFDDVGVGVNIHNGSALNGGTIVIYFNEI